MAQLHVVVTGPAACGKTSVCRMLQHDFSCPYLDTLYYHQPASLFTVQEAASALGRFLSDLRRQLASGELVISEGFFLDDTRREAVWRATTDAGARLLPVTLQADEATILSRLASRNLGAAKPVPQAEGLRFQREFLAKPWGAALETTRCSVEQVKNAVRDLIASWNRPADRSLLLYYDNSNLETILRAIGRVPPLPNTGEFLRLAQAVDGLVYADVVTLLDYPNDEAYQSSTYGIQQSFLSSPLITLFLPYSIQDSEVIALSRSDLDALVHHLRNCRSRGLLDTAIDGSLAAIPPSLVRQHAELLKAIFTDVAKGRLPTKLESALHAVSWFLSVLKDSPELYRELQDLLEQCHASAGEAWLAAHRLFRCYFHLYAARLREATYWPSAQRNKLIETGLNDPVNVFHSDLFAPRASKTTLPSERLDREARAAVPFFGAYILMRCGADAVSPGRLCDEVLRLRQEGDVLAIRSLVRRFYALLSSGPAPASETKSVLRELRSVGQQVRRSLEWESVPLVEREARLANEDERDAAGGKSKHKWETSAACFAWVLSNLESQPGVQRDLREEDRVNVNSRNVQQPKVVFPLHGIRTRAAWQRLFSDVSSAKGWTCRMERWDFGYFWFVRLLLPWQRRAKVRWFRKAYDAEVHDRDVKVAVHENKLPSVIAHSFGTYILGNALLKYDNIRFNKIILCGSILPRDFPWDELINRGQVQAVRNEFGTKDLPSRLVKYVVGDSGPSGVEGFLCAHPRFEQQEFQGFTHSEYFERGHIEDKWLPFLENPLALIPRQQTRVRPRTSSSAICYRILLTVLTVLCALIAYRVGPSVFRWIKSIVQPTAQRADPNEKEGDKSERTRDALAVTFKDGHTGEVELSVAVRLIPEKAPLVVQLYGTQERADEHLDSLIVSATLSVLERATSEEVRVSRDIVERRIEDELRPRADAFGYAIVSVSLRQIRQ